MSDIERNTPEYFEYWDKVIERIERLAKGCKVIGFDPDVLLSSEGKATVSLPKWFVDCLIATADEADLATKQKMHNEPH